MPPMKKIFAAFGFLLLIFICEAQNKPGDVKIYQFITSLITKMTMDEKIG